SVTWADFAYSTYATGPQHLCNSVMLMGSLLRVGAKADRLLLYTDEWEVEDVNSTEARLLRQARDQYGVRVKAVRVVRPEGVEDAFWAEGFTKWLAFNQTQYKRVLAMDSDATILRPLDELFLMPSAPVAIPGAYWLDDSLSAQLTLVQPSTAGFQAISDKIKLRKPNDYDMEIINAVYGIGSAIIPHRPYNLVTGEFRARNHAKYLGSMLEKWDAEAVIQEAKYVHFSDWPLPKPWEPHTQQQWDEVRPMCVNEGECSEFRIRARLYEEFRQRRKDVCG
ncbi:nucleotide-diphospho-sugar transferase, partial [Teratosphaeria nubilosa]